MSEQTIIPLSVDGAKGFLIATAVMDFEITAQLIRDHVSGKEHATHSALLHVANALDSAKIEYDAKGVIETYRSMQHLYHLVMVYFNADPSDYAYDVALYEDGVRKQLKIVGNLLYGERK